MERMMKEMQERMMVRQQEMLEGFFQRLGQQETAGVAGIQNQ